MGKYNQTLAHGAIIFSGAVDEYECRELPLEQPPPPI